MLDLDSKSTTLRDNILCIQQLIRLFSQQGVLPNHEFISPVRFVPVFAAFVKKKSPMNLSQVINPKNLWKLQSAQYFLKKFPIECGISQRKFGYYLFFVFLFFFFQVKKKKMKPRVFLNCEYSKYELSLIPLSLITLKANQILSPLFSKCVPRPTSSFTSATATQVQEATVPLQHN